jgi:peptidyl-prolyl cis-trans isomerase D
MFDSIRNNSKILMGLLFLLVIPSFVLLGMEGYSQFEDKGAVVARVDGQKITQSEWNAAHQMEVDRIRTSVPNLDPKLLDSAQARYATLEKIVNDRLIARASEKQLLVTSDQRLARYLQQEPSIASLRGPDGKLDLERYRQLAASQGMTLEMLEARVRQDLSNQQVLAGLQASVLVSPKQSDAALDAYLQRREIQLKRWNPGEFAAKVQVSDEDLNQYYQANSERFRSVESVDLEYLLLDLASVQSRIELPPQDLKTYYEQNLQRLGGQEQRRASHILVNAAKDLPAADKEKARTKAESLLASVRKSPATFAETARKNSDDSGSAVRGGDLDFFARGAMVKPFEDAAFALQKGEISGIVESDFGYHIILLTDVKLPQVPTFESMRPQIEADLRKQQAQRQFAELAETFSNSVYEQSDNLAPVAERLKLSIQKAQNLTRTSAPAASSVLSNPKLVQAIFSEDAIVKRRNTAAVEVAPNTLVSARVVKHRPAAVRPLEEVKQEVRQQWIQTKSAELAKAEGQTRLSAWKTDAVQAALAETVIVSRDQALALPQAAIDAALRADPAQMPVLLGVDLGMQGYAVVRVNKIVPRPPATPQQSEQSRQQFARLWGQAESQAYLSSLKSQFKVEMLVEKPPKLSNAASENP